MSEQLHSKIFFIGDKGIQRLRNIEGILKNRGVPSWVKIAINAILSEVTPFEIIKGSYKLAVINKTDGLVYTLEILPKNIMERKKQIYQMYRQILKEHDKKLQIMLPIETFYHPITDGYFAYLTMTDYCSDVYSVLENRNYEALNTLEEQITLYEQMIALMNTYATLCDNEIYLVDIKPENMLLCSDGLYFIDVDDVSIVKGKNTPDISESATHYYKTHDWEDFLYKVDRGYVKKERIRTRLEYEGWQALVKTYFGIKTGKQNEYNDMVQLLGRDSIFYGWIGNWLRQRTDPLIEQDSMLFNVLNSYNTGNDASIKNKNIRNWLAHENIRFYLKNLKVGRASSLSPNIKLRF